MTDRCRDREVPRLDGDVDATIRHLLADTHTWAVVGLSNDTMRAAYGVSRFLQRQGKRIVPVHPDAETVHGEPGYRTLGEIPFPVDVVEVFVRSDRAGAVADAAIEIGAKAVWFQLGVVDDAAYGRVTRAGLLMVMNHCPAVEWPRRGPRPPTG